MSGPARLGIPDAVILPGCKSTVADLDYLRENGLAAQVVRLAHLGVPVIGICGGYQMLGERIEDPGSVESCRRETEGLGLLPVTTVLGGGKSTHRVRAVVERAVPFMGLEPSAAALAGYEIHMGDTRGGSRPPLLITERDGVEANIPDGAHHDRLPVFGCYLHGLFENRPLMEAFLNQLRRRRGPPRDAPGAGLAGMEGRASRPPCRRCPPLPGHPPDIFPPRKVERMPGRGLFSASARTSTIME